MRVLGIIPSRYQSSRFPGKPLIDLAGKSMIRRVYENAALAKGLSELIVATDDDRIFNEVKSFGGNVIMTGEQHQSGTERCGEVLKSQTGFDVVINIQGDEPLLHTSQIEALIHLFNNLEVNIGTLVKRIESSDDIFNPNRIKVVLDEERNGIYFSRSPIPHVAGIPQTEWLNRKVFFRHVGIYAWRTKVLEKLLKLPATELEKTESLEQLRWIYHGYKIRTAETSIETPNIDVPEDVEKVLTILNEKT